MTEAVASGALNALSKLKTNQGGNIILKGGRLYNEDQSTRVTIGGGTAANADEAIRGEDNLELTRAKSFTGTGNLTVSNGSIRVTTTNGSTPVTLI